MHRLANSPSAVSRPFAGSRLDCLLHHASVALPVICAIGMVLHTAITIGNLFTAVPWGDRNTDILRIHEHGVRFLDLFQPHNEHIIFVPRLFMLADMYLFSTTNRFLVFMSFALMLAVAGIFSLAAARGLFRNRVDALLYACLVVVLYVNAMHAFDLLCGLMIQHWLMLVFSLSFGLVLAALLDPHRTPGDARRLALLAGLGFCSLFSSGSGLFCLVAAVVVAAAFRAGWRQVSALAVISTVLLFTYLKCNAEGTHADFSCLWKEPRSSAKCFFAFLGAPGLRYHVWPADRQFWTFDGWIAVSRGMAVFMLGTLLCLREWLRPAQRTRFAVFHAFLIVLVFGTALAVVPSRLKLAVYEGVNVKYTNTVLLAWIAILSLGLKQLAEAGSLSRPQRQTAWIAALAAALTLVLPAHFREIQVWRQWTNHLWESESMLVAGVYDERLMKTLDWRPQELYDVLQNEYRGKHWSVFSRYPFDIGDPLQRHYQLAQDYACRGDFDAAADPTAAGLNAGVMLTGWAWDETRRQPFHDIIFTDDADRIVGIAHSNRERDDVVRYFNDSARLRSGWFGCARQGAAAPLRAYGLIPGTGKVCLICRRATVGPGTLYQ